MPKITNKSILTQMTKSLKMAEKLIKDGETYDKKIANLQKENQKFVDLMNEEYGYGNWQNVDTKTNTFQSREEVMDKFYVIKNPAMRERVDLPDDIKLDITAETVQ